jgi:hypothetical protein
MLLFTSLIISIVRVQMEKSGRDEADGQKQERKDDECFHFDADTCI